MTTGPQKNTYETFIQFIKKWLENLGVNSKLFTEIIEDEALPMTVRALASGVLIYLQSPIDLIPDKLKFLGVIDDVIIMIVGLVIITPLMPKERLNYYIKKYESVGKVDEYEQGMKAMLGILWERLQQFVEMLRTRTFKNKTTEEIAQSSEFREDLFDETMIFVANLNLDPDSLDGDIKLLPAPEKVIGLLSSGLEEAQKQQTKDENSVGQAKSAFKRMLLSATGKQEPNQNNTKENKLLQ